MNQELTVVQKNDAFSPTKEDYQVMSVGEPQNMLEVRALANFLCRSKFIPQAFRGDLNTAVMLIVTCKQYGLPITALSETMEVNGKVGFWGRTKLGIILKSPVCEYIMATEKTDKKCVVVAKRKGWPKEVTVEWTIEQADKAGLIKRSDAWQKYPKRMLYWRAISDAISEVFPDVIQGFATVEDEEEASALPQVQAVAMPEEAPKVKRARKVKAVVAEEEKSESPILPTAEEMKTYEPKIEEQPVEEIVADEEEQIDDSEVAAFFNDEPAPAKTEQPKRPYYRFIKQVMIEGGVRYLVGINPLNQAEDRFVIPTAAQAAELKRLTGTQVALIIENGQIVSYESAQ